MYWTGNKMCVVCNVKSPDASVSQLKRLIQFLYSKKLERVSNNNIRFNWGTVERCPVGMASCQKINSNQREFNRLTNEAEELLVAYLDNPTFNIYEILRYLQGYFPSVYKELEREYYIRNKKSED